MPNSLFQQPKKKSPVFGMLCGSLVFHTALVGTAALWNHPQSAGPVCILTTIVDDPGDVPAPGDQVLEPPPMQLPPEMAPVPVVDSTPVLDDSPAVVDQNIVDPTPPKPVTSLRNTQAHALPRVANQSSSASHSQVVSSSRSGTTSASGGAVGSNGAGLVGWQSPKPSYPYALKAIRAQGIATVRVVTDARGRVTEAVIVKSSGNKALDDNTLSHIRAEWSGPPNASMVREIEYKLN